ncbi:MAG TPA: NAD-dependent epimerase/dehydratase family protein [Opitutaceae bacterium]|nr:NAD-dependent epimerase/dehydratase family protein [Opitutaceae bacterium]
MRILISGICGFSGSAIARALAAQGRGYEISGFDNFIRPGSEGNRAELKRLGIRLVHGDVRAASDIDALPACDWVIDAAANPSILAGVDGLSSSRQLVEHNLGGTVNLLEYCKRSRAGFILLSTSRVYSIAPLAGLPMQVAEGAFRPGGGALPAGVGPMGVTESFPTSAPVSLYGATKLASEALALEYGQTFDLPVFINRCGILAGAGQFGRPDQGIYAYWINSHLRRRPLKYIGFGGKGHQVRDCLHPSDLAPLLAAQFAAPRTDALDRIVNVGGGAPSATSLLQLNDWCDGRFGPHPVASEPAPRPFDIPWIVLDPSKAGRIWGWKPAIPVQSILEEIAAHAGAHPGWLELSAPLG